MQLLIYALVFMLGVISTLAVLVYWAWYLGMKEKIHNAEAARQEMEDAVKEFEEQQRAAAEALQNSLKELLKPRQTNQPTSTTPTPQVSVDPNASASVKERLRKAVEITSKQSKIDTKKGPEFLTLHNELELEKLSVLKTILADGFDPVITIRFNTGDQEMLLSAYIQSINKGLA